MLTKSIANPRYQWTLIAYFSFGTAHFFTRFMSKRAIFNYEIKCFVLLNLINYNK